MNPTDLTIEILKSIRDEVRETRTDLGAKIDQTNARLDQTNARLEYTSERIDGTNTRVDSLARRVVESEVRTSTAIADLHGTVRDLVDVLRVQRDVRPRLDRAEHEITEIKQRLGM